MTPSTSHAEKVREKQDSTKNGLTTAVGNDVKGGKRKSEEIHSKDALEEKLEKILFGDDMGFHLSDHEEQEKELEPKTDYVANESDAESMDFANMNDEDLFFIDTGPKNAPAAKAEVEHVSSERQDKKEFKTDAAWEDSDEERMNVSLGASDRLKKLRISEAEDEISGKEYVRRLRMQFEIFNPVPDWGSPEAITNGRASKRRKTGDGEEDFVSSEEEMDDKDEHEMSLQPLARFLQNATDFTREENGAKTRTNRKLRPEVLDIARLKDISGSQPSSVDSLSFHPSYPLILSSGPASTLFLHHVSPHSAAPNPLLTSLHVRRTPIWTSAFSRPDGNRIFFSGRRRYFHVWDLDTGKISKVARTADRKQEQRTMEQFKLSPCGRWMGLVAGTKKGGGVVNILSTTTAQWVAQVRIDSREGIADFAWWGDGEGMCVAGKNGEVSEWDGRQRRVVACWTDEGAIGTTVLSLGGHSGRTELGGDRWIAVGSSSGIVNVYDRRPWAAAAASPATCDTINMQTGVPHAPKPTRTLDQLTTAISHLVFSLDGQLLVMGSRWKKDALRLVHLPSCIVYRNWPTSNTAFGRISAVAISPMSDMLAVANDQGKIRLWGIQR